MKRNAATFRSAFCYAGVCLACLLGCTQSQRLEPASSSNSIKLTQWPDDWSKYLGQRVTVEGWSDGFKLGPEPETHHLSIVGTKFVWIENRKNPDGSSPPPVGGKSVRATGILIRRDDMPVWVAGNEPENGAPGVRVESKEEFERLKWRYLISDATCEALISGGKR